MSLVHSKESPRLNDELRFYIYQGKTTDTSLPSCFKWQSLVLYISFDYTYIKNKIN